jgi:spermidine synthase
MSLSKIALDARSPRVGAALLGVCMFTTGGAGLVIEYVIATTTSFILGSSIIVFSLVIGVMLGAMGAAGWIQERVGDNNLLEKFFAIEVLLALAGGFAPIVLFWAYGAYTEHFNLILYTLTVFIGLLIGLEIPVVMRIIAQLGIGLRVNLKYVFGADYLGAMVFMLLWVFWLLPSFPITEVGFMVSCLNFLVAIVAVMYFGWLGGFRYFYSVVAITVLVALALGYGYANNRSWSVYLEQRMYEDPIIYQATTKYQHLVLTESKQGLCGVEYRLYINGNTQFSSCDEMVYHDNLVHPAMNLAAAHDRVLILGGGDGLALRDVLTYSPQSVTLVDLDPDMVDLARDNPYLSELNRQAFADARVTTLESPAVAQEGGMYTPVAMMSGEIDPDTGAPEIIHVTDVQRMHIDAGKFLEIVSDTYDVIIVDLPDPSSVEISRLYSRGFYQHLARRLAPGGVAVVQSTSPIHAREVYLEIGRTIAAAGLEVIPYHDNVPSFGEWGYWLACQGEGCAERIRSDIAALDSFLVSTRYLTARPPPGKSDVRTG